MKKAIYRHGLTLGKIHKWERAIAAGNSMMEIWTDLRVDDDFRRMAVMAMTAPTVESYDYPTGSELTFGSGGRPFVVSPAWIGNFYRDRCNSFRPEALMDVLQSNTQLVHEYGEAILFWLRQTGITMFGKCNDIDYVDWCYCWAIENLLAAFPLDSEITDELFAFHPVNCAEEYFRGTVGVSFRADLILGLFRGVVCHKGVPKKYVMAAMRKLIDIAQMQESGKLPAPSERNSVAGDASRILCEMLSGVDVGLGIDGVAEENIDKVFELVYGFLRGSNTPFFGWEIENIAQRIGDDEERYSFCARMLSRLETNAKLYYSGYEWILEWLLGEAMQRGDISIVEFVAALSSDFEEKKARDEEMKEGREAEKKMMVKRRSETFGVLFAEK